MSQTSLDQRGPSRVSAGEIARGQPVTSKGRPQAPLGDDTLSHACACQASTGHDIWTSCGHAHCTSIRNQWQHLKTCLPTAIIGEPCKECQLFHQLIQTHHTCCRQENCIFSRMGKVRNGRPPPQLLQTNSAQDFNRLEAGRNNKRLLLLNDGGSLDDMALSPLSPTSLNRLGVSALPPRLRSNFSQRAEEIMRGLESEGLLDDLSPPVEDLAPQPSPLPPPPTQQVALRGGVLSPIEEHPSSDGIENMSCDYPAQKILHPLHSDFLTQGRDGRYLHRRDYDLNEHLGEGGFGTCACARDCKTDKMFVIKSNKSNDEKVINSLKAESAILSRIPHHNNITLFLGALMEEEESKEGPLKNCRLMMELAEHGSLASMLRDEEGGADPLPLDQSMFYLHQILQGVFHIHTLSIVHLDIKAENVLVLEGGRRVKLADFGTASHIDEIAGCVSKLSIGFTPHFSAPEIIRGDIPSFSSDIWSSMCVLIQLITAQLPGYDTGASTRESMMYMLGNYKDSDIEKLVPLTQLGVPSDVSKIFSDTLRVDPTSRPSALDLLSYDALKDACEYEQYFDMECSQLSEQEEEQLQSGLEPSLEGAETSSFGHTPPTLITRPLGDHEDSDVSLDRPLRGKKMSEDSGVSQGYERMQSEVFPLEPNDDSGIDTPGQETYPIQRMQGRNIETGGVITEEEGEERYTTTSMPDRAYSQPEAQIDYLSINYRRRSRSATYQRPTTMAQEGLKFTQAYPDANDSFLSLPTRPTSGFGSFPQKMRPKFLIHSNSAPVVGTGNGGDSETGSRGRSASGLGNGNGASKRLRRSSSEVYVDRGPDIDTPEEKKKKELALAAAAKEAEEQDLAAMTANLRIDQTSSSVTSHSPPSQRGYASSRSNQSDRSNRGYQVSYSRQTGTQSHRGHTHHIQLHDGRDGGYIRETLV